ncbi:MAG: hypothetical protein SGJ27_02110 [Candidatus Melainabacteria bacterium]|nr:hypothetical protein [Candidatus Melainabacteria bacterium]
MTNSKIDKDADIHKTVFVSCDRIDASDPQALIAELRRCGFTVGHSPRDPFRNYDPEWDDHSVVGSDAFVIVLDRGWDSSSALAMEAQEAEGSLEGYVPIPMFFYNPSAVIPAPQAIGVLPYLKEELPPNPTEAVAFLIERLR